MRIKRYPDVVIRASAGTGKTFRLSNRYLGQLHAGADPDQILATTFTKKAAGEIFERILIRLAEACLREESRRELATFIEAPSLSQRRCYQLLEQFVRHLHRIRVSTLDSFFMQIASGFTLELGLPPGWTIIDDVDDATLRSRAIETILTQGEEGEIDRLIHLLSKGEAERWINDMIGDAVSDLHRVFLETSPEAWRQIPQPPCLSSDDLAEAVNELLRVELPPHKRIESARASDYQSAVANDWETFIGRGLAKKILNGDDTYYGKTIPPPVLALYERLLGHARAVILRILNSQLQGTRELLERFDAEYQRLKHQARVLRFDDVTRLLANTSLIKETSALGFRMDGNIAHLLLDEFQDTSLSQWQVLRPFAKQATSKSRDGSFFCVGDAKQAIYGWRGGSAEIFDALDAHLDGLTVESLDCSYRSSQPVIDTVNTVFTGLSRHTNLDDYHEAVTRWQTRFREHRTARGNLPGYACLMTAAALDEDESGNDATLRCAADRIRQSVQETPGATIGVLLRTNQNVARMIFELRRQGISASEEGGNPLTDSAAVQSLLSLLRLADHPGDRVARYHVANSPLGNLCDLTDDTDSARADHLAYRLRTALLTHGYGATLYDWVIRLLPHCGRRDLSRLKQLVELAYRYDRDASLRPSDFVSRVEFERVADPTADAVRVLTVHQSKGLQFDIVVLPDLDAGLVGQSRSFATRQQSCIEPIDCICLHRNANVQALLPEDLQRMFAEATETRISEALCVLYVALTRAVHALYLVIAPSKKKEKSLPKTAAGLLRAALTDAQPADAEAILYECGHARWDRERDVQSPTVAATGAAAASTPLTVSVAPMPDGRHRGLGRIAPSKREGAAKTTIDTVFRMSDTSAMDRGTLIHAWFEQIQWLEDGIPDEARLRHVAAQLGASHLDLDRLISEFHQMIEAPEISLAMSRSAYRKLSDLGFDQSLDDRFDGCARELEVQNEREFAVRLENAVVAGSIDRLVVLRCEGIPVAADVIDFKTDSISADSEQLAQRVDHYRGQLETYRPAVAKLYDLPLDCISARLLMLGPGIVCPVNL